MRNLNHDRPELRYKDNIRRELEKLSGEVTRSRHSQGWPVHLQPVAQNPKAISALASFLEGLDAWAASDNDDFDFLRPPSSLRDDFNRFRLQRIVASHSGGLTIDDWLDELEPEGQDDLRPFLRIFRDLWK